MELIIDTSSDKLKLILNDKNIYENEETNPKHLKHLLPEIDKILEKSSHKLNDIDTFSVVLGPGSFTGVRIGVSTVKAFGCALKNKKYIGINMLELLAYTIVNKLPIKTDFCIIIKSTSTKYYFALCNNKAEVKKMNLLTTEELILTMQENKLPLFSYNFNFNNEVVSTNIDLLTLDYLKYNEYKKSKNLFATLVDLKPIYLALSQAEEELNKRLNNGNKNN